MKLVDIYMNLMIKKFLSDESGATAIEYGLIAILISIAIVVSLHEVGRQLSILFTKIADILRQANSVL